MDPATNASNGKPHRRLGVLSLGALGVVYGDIGTSPLYAVRESFSGHFGVEPTAFNVLGVLSLIAWSLVLIVCVKYLWLVLRADNEGEGGILALTALADPRTAAPQAASSRPSRARASLLLVGAFGAALLFSDAVLTPAISVLSAVEGLDVVQPALQGFVVPITVLILLFLFAFQYHGTGRVGALFGPVTLVWFLVLAALGVQGILLNPSILAALNPAHAVEFLLDGGIHGYLVLGAVFLVVTGSEALYADMGHFGRAPIRLAWFLVAFPALLLNYFGQGALILADSSTTASPFYLLAPSWARIPLIVLATLATIIASQAVITGIFSLANQAVQLGYWPRLLIKHTSAEEFGQVYVPAANLTAAALTILLVVSFQSSAALAAAYGIAIVSTMVVTTLLLFVVAPERWGWPRPLAYAVLLVFLGMEFLFLGANLTKISEGGWVPVLLGGFFFALMLTWQSGRTALGKRISKMLVPLGTFLDQLPEAPIVRVPGNAVYMTGNPEFTPPPLLKNLEHQKTLHERVVFLTIETGRVPLVRNERRVEYHEMRHGFFRVTARYGFLQTPDVTRLFQQLRTQGLKLELDETTFFLGRERVLSRDAAPLARLKVAVFGFMARNSQRATAYFNIPPDRVVEVGSQIEM